MILSRAICKTKVAEVLVAQSVRLTRRMVGVFRARLPETALDKVHDPTKQRWKRLGVLLKAAVVGIMAGCKGLAEVEALTAEMSPPMRGMLGIKRRVPDTTLRTILTRLDPKDLRSCLHIQTRLAHRRKALAPVGLPFGVVAIDGKTTALLDWDRARAQRKGWSRWNALYAQRQAQEKTGTSCRLVRTMTCSLVSAAAKACIDAVPIPARTNEMGHFQSVLSGLVRNYRRSGLFQVVSTDAGSCSEANGRAVVETHKLHYLFRLKADQPTLLAEAKRLLGRLRPEEAEAKTVDVVGRTTVTRHLHRSSEMAGYLAWDHLQTAIRIRSEKHDIETGELLEAEDHYAISSLPSETLSAAQWLLLFRLHWGVENQCHNTWDTAFQEDNKPWIETDPKGMVVVLLLRRIAYNMMALFRSVTQRSEEKRRTPWKTLIRWTYNALVAATAVDIEGLRVREAATAGT
jgi:hypothetical protein